VVGGRPGERRRAQRRRQRSKWFAVWHGSGYPIQRKVFLLIDRNFWLSRGQGDKQVFFCRSDRAGFAAKRASGCRPDGTTATLRKLFGRGRSVRVDALAQRHRSLDRYLT